jgi:hypothetical protein
MKVKGRSLAGRVQSSAARKTAHDCNSAVKSVKTPNRGILADVSFSVRRQPQF